MSRGVGLAVAIVALKTLSRKAVSAKPLTVPASASSYEQVKGRPYSAGPPEPIALPAGWRRMRGEEVGAAERAFAVRALKTKGAPGHRQVETLLDGTEVMALTEWHFHEPGGAVRPWGWHTGITLLVRDGG